jgi:hypothetical protein
MPKHVFAIAALSALMACAAVAQSETNSAPALAEEVVDLGCDIRLTPTRRGLRIEALAQSERSGDYELVVSKDGPSGTSEIVQGGPIEAVDDAEFVLSASEFGVERGDRYSARLVLRDADGVFCRAERRS